MDSFNLFLEQLGDLRDIQLNMKELKNEFKLPKKNFPKLSKMIHYFKTEFAMRTRNESRTKWHNYDKQLLFWVVCKYCQMHSKYIVASLFKKGQTCMDDNDWNEISRILGVETKILKNKWLVMVKPQVKNSPWTQEEDQILQKLIDPNDQNHNWTEVATCLAEMTHNNSFRNAKQIRERWNNYLNPTLKKSEWEETEDINLLESVLMNGKKWSQISQIMRCRTESQVKNRFNSISNRLKKTYGDGYLEESLIQMELSLLKGEPSSFQHQILASNHNSNFNQCQMPSNSNCQMMRNQYQRSQSFKSNNNYKDNIIFNIKEESNSSETLQKLSYRNNKQSTQSHTTSGGVLSDYLSPQQSTNNSFPQMSETVFLPDSHQHEIFANSQYLQPKKNLISPSHQFQIPVPPSHAKNQSTQNHTQIYSNQSEMADFTTAATNYFDSTQQTLKQQTSLIQLNQQIFHHDEHVNNTNNQFTNFHSFNNTVQQLNFLCPPNNNNTNTNNSNNSNNNNLFIEDWGFGDQSNNNNNNNFNLNQGSNGNNVVSNNSIITPNNNKTNIFYPNSSQDFNQALHSFEQAELRRGSNIIQESQKQFPQSNSLFTAQPNPPNHPAGALSFFTEETY